MDGQTAARALTAASLSLVLTAPAAAGNHFLAEVEGGVARPVGAAAEVEETPAYQAAFGVGGRLRGHAPAYYLIGRVGWSILELQGPRSFGAARVSRDQVDWGIGGRVYLPLLGERLRLKLELALGQVHETSWIRREALGGLQLSEVRGAFFAGGGLQVRLTNHISIGGNVDLAWTPERSTPDLTRLAAGIPGPFEGLGRLRLGLVTTVQF